MAGFSPIGSLHCAESGCLTASRRVGGRDRVPEPGSAKSLLRANLTLQMGSSVASPQTGMQRRAIDGDEMDITVLGSGPADEGFQRV